MDIVNEILRHKQEQEESAKRRIDVPPSDEKKEVDNARKTTLPTNDSLAWERVLGSSGFLQTNYLLAGWRAASAVCCISVRDAQTGSFWSGSGFMVAPNVLMTNNHVLPTLEICRAATARFNYQLTIEMLPEVEVPFSLEPDILFLTDSNLDVTFVAVQSINSARQSLDRFGFLKLLRRRNAVTINEFVSIVQHPKGLPKQVALRENQVVHISDQFLRYRTNTSRGSSGSPVFNDQWYVVALHHVGTDDWNEGIVISAILDWLSEKLPTQSSKAQTLLAPVLHVPELEVRDANSQLRFLAPFYNAATALLASSSSSNSNIL